VNAPVSLFALANVLVRARPHATIDLAIIESIFVSCDVADGCAYSKSLYR
jgi:hypothetical protein